MGKSIRILILEDSPGDADLMVVELKRAGYDPVYERVDTPQGMISLLERGDWEIVLADYNMPSFTAIEALELLKASRFDIPFIVVSGSIGEDVAVKAMRAGAQDYIMKDNMARLVPAIERELVEAVVRVERKHADMIIARLGRILEDSLNEITVFDFETYMFLEANNGARTNMGYSMEELRELSALDLKPSVDRDEFESIIEPLKSGTVEQLEFMAEHRRKDGSTYMAEIHMQKTTYEGSPAFVSIILDITDRVRAEKEQDTLRVQLQQAQKMEAVGVLAAGVAHDFNNILTTIGLNSEIAMSEVNHEHPAYSCMVEVLTASQRAKELTHQLLIFSRKEALNFIIGDLNVTVAGLLKMLVRLIGEDVHIETDLDAALKPVSLDKVSMEQVLMNLSINARDAMHDSGTISIKTSNVSIDSQECKQRIEARQGDFVCLSVSDTGSGMDTETMAHIFEPFYTTKCVGKGTGLGLSVVYGIAKQHNGWIEVASEPGKGTEFSLYIPAQPEAAKKVEPEGTVDKPVLVDGLRVLLIEDEPNIRTGVSKILAQRGFVVFEAENASMARALFDKEKGSFDLVLSDVILPDGTGIELVDEFRAEKPELKILLSSGYTEEKSQWSLIKDLKYNFIQKPYRVSELLDAVMESIKTK